MARLSASAKRAKERLQQQNIDIRVRHTLHDCASIKSVTNDVMCVIESSERRKLKIKNNRLNQSDEFSKNTGRIREVPKAL